MGLPWFRFYAEALHDRKVQTLDPPAFKTWVNVLCLACGGGGVLPAMPDIAFALRMSESGAARAVRELQGAGLIDQTINGLEPHNWRGRQFQSDSSTERTREYRQRKRHSDGAGNVTVTVQNRYISEQNTHRSIPTVENIVDWQAFSLWAASGLHRDPDSVLEAIEDRAPGFLEAEARRWQDELDRGNRCTFERDFVPALVLYGMPLPTPATRPTLEAAASDPRVVRMQSYAARCTENPALCDPWPCFESFQEAAWAA